MAADICDDFYTITTAAIPINSAWMQIAANSGTVANALGNGATDLGQVLQLSTATSSASGTAGVYSGAKVACQFKGNFHLIAGSVNTWAAETATDTWYQHLGFDYDGGGGTVGASYCGFVYDPYKGSAVGSQITATNNWQCVTGASSTFTVTDSGVPFAAQTYQQLCVILNDTTNAVFRINGSIVATNSSNLPITALFPVTAIHKTLGTGLAGQMYVDWIYQSVWWAATRNFQ